MQVDGRPVAHIFDLRTGLPLDSEWGSAIVVAPTAFEADMLSTASFVCGPEKSKQLLGCRTYRRLIFTPMEKAEREN